MSDNLEDIEIRLLLEALFQRYHYDFRNYAPASLKRRLRQARDQLVLQRARARRDGDLAAGLVGVPDRHRQRRTVGAFDCDHADVKVGQKALAFLVAHLRHAPANRCDAADIPVTKGIRVGRGNCAIGAAPR